MQGNGDARHVRHLSHDSPDLAPLTDADRDVMRASIREFYRVAGAGVPAIVFVPSPTALDAFLRRRRRMRHAGPAAVRDWRQRRRPLRLLLALAVAAIGLLCGLLLVQGWQAFEESADRWTDARTAAATVIWPLAALVTGAVLCSFVGRPGVERRWGDGAVSDRWHSPDDLTHAEPSRVAGVPDGSARPIVWRLAGAAGGPGKTRHVDAGAALDARWTGDADASQARWPDALRISQRYRPGQRLLVPFATARGGAQTVLPFWTTVARVGWAVAEGLVVPSDRLRHELAVRTATDKAFAWAGFRYVAIVVEPPVSMRAEAVPDGSLRLHADREAALVWADGERQYFLHGVRVPEQLLLGNWSAGDIHREPDSAVRRAAIERMGWRAYVEQARLHPVARQPDPGNPDAELMLYDIPEGTARLLVMRNGSPDRSGGMREFAELVPRWLGDPVQAAAWQYGCSADEYRRMQRRT